MAPLPMGEEEEALLQKDADGDESDDAMVFAGEEGAAPQMSRAQRRAQKAREVKGVKNAKSPCEYSHGDFAFFRLNKRRKYET